jgi:DNA-directed RNA polymerase subunit M/transcription elongation factor TFIIS
MGTQPAPYVPMSVTCSNCNEKQTVYVLSRTGAAKMREQEIKCVNCHGVFRVTAPDRMVAGPFRI